MDILIKQQENPCVICTDQPLCPQCAHDEVCVITALTCNSCPTTFCKKTADTIKVNGQSHYTLKVGLIVGSLIGGIVLIVLLLLIRQYFKHWRHRSKQNSKSLAGIQLDNERILEKDIENDSDAAKDKEFDASQYLKNRNSIETLMTKDSNILTIAYIPGVTAVPMNNKHIYNNGDTHSHISLGSSILNNNCENDMKSDTESIYTSDFSNITVQLQDCPTTAIRAKPRLVKITEEEEEIHQGNTEKSSQDRISIDSTLKQHISGTIESELQGSVDSERLIPS